MIHIEDRTDLKPWEKLREIRSFERIPFTVSDVNLRTAKGDVVEFARIDSPDWVNVVPVDKKTGDIFLIRQYRVGPGGFVLETPGGNMDPGEKDPTVAARRELEEETGLISNRLLPLGSFNPNSALFSNQIHFFLAADCEYKPTSKNPDQHEDIEVVRCPISRLDELIRTGQISHGLSALGLLLSKPYLGNEQSS